MNPRTERLYSLLWESAVQQSTKATLGEYRRRMGSSVTSPPHPTSVVDDLLCQKRPVEAGEFGVVDQQEHNVGRVHGLVHLGECDVVALLELRRQPVDIRFDSHNGRLGEFVGELTDDLTSGALPQVIDVRFERQAKSRDPYVLDPSSLGEELVEDIPGLGVVDLTSGPDQGGLLRRGRDDEPRVDGDAVSADARTRLQDVDPWVMVREPDELPHVDVETIGDHRQLIGEGDVDIAVSVLSQLRHLRRPRIGHEELTLAEQLVQVPCPL